MPSPPCDEFLFTTPCLSVSGVCTERRAAPCVSFLRDGRCAAGGEQRVESGGELAVQGLVMDIPRATLRLSLDARKNDRHPLEREGQGAHTQDPSAALAAEPSAPCVFSLRKGLVTSTSGFIIQVVIRVRRRSPTQLPHGSQGDLRSEFRYTTVEIVGLPAR
jgi:hypothetical protein